MENAKNLCECSNLEWDESIYHLEHHPNCTYQVQTRLEPVQIKDDVWNHGGPIDAEFVKVEYTRPIGDSPISLIDLLYEKRIRIPDGLYENIRTDEAINLILDAVEIPEFRRKLDKGNAVLNNFWADNENAVNAIHQILIVEGIGASLYEDGEGNIVFEKSGREDRTREY